MKVLPFMANHDPSRRWFSRRRCCLAIVLAAALVGYETPDGRILNLGRPASANAAMLVKESTTALRNVIRSFGPLIEELWELIDKVELAKDASEALRGDDLESLGTVDEKLSALRRIIDGIELPEATQVPVSLDEFANPATRCTAVSTLNANDKNIINAIGEADALRQQLDEADETLKKLETVSFELSKVFEELISVPIQIIHSTAVDQWLKHYVDNMELARQIGDTIDKKRHAAAGAKSSWEVQLALQRKNALPNIEVFAPECAAEELQRVMDQTRAGASTIAARHRQVMDRVDATREQRSSALTQQMQGTLQHLQQQQLMLLQQQGGQQPTAASSSNRCAQVQAQIGAYRRQLDELRSDVNAYTEHVEQGIRENQRWYDANCR